MQESLIWQVSASLPGKDYCCNKCLKWKLKCMGNVIKILSINPKTIEQRIPQAHGCYSALLGCSFPVKTPIRELQSRKTLYRFQPDQKCQKFGCLDCQKYCNNSCYYHGNFIYIPDWSVISILIDKFFVKIPAHTISDRKQKPVGCWHNCRKHNCSYKCPGVFRKDIFDTCDKCGVRCIQGRQNSCLHHRAHRKAGYLDKGYDNKVNNKNRYRCPTVMFSVFYRKNVIYNVWCCWKTKCNKKEKGECKKWSKKRLATWRIENRCK